MFPYEDISVDWTHERFDAFLSNPLNLIDINKGGQFLCLLRDYIQNTTQITHAFLLAIVCNEMVTDTKQSKTQILYDEDSDSDIDGQ